MHNKLASIWRPGRGVTAEDLGNKLLLFRFYHERDILWVIDNGTWSFDNAHLVMHELQEGKPRLRLRSTRPSFGSKYMISHQYSVTKLLANPW
ncbi:hypothetical protein LINPERHAP2_LOCUS40330 [Linum perenne]